MSQYSHILTNCGSRFVVQVTCASGALRKLSGEQDTSPHTSHPTPHISHFFAVGSSFRVAISVKTCILAGFLLASLRAL